MKLIVLLIDCATFFLSLRASTPALVPTLNPCNVIGEGLNGNPSYCHAFDNSPRNEISEFGCCVLANEEAALPAALNGSVKVHKKSPFVGKIQVEINHNGRNSVLYPLDVTVSSHIIFLIDKISPECFSNKIYKLEVSYDQNQSDRSSSNSCTLCKTKIEIKNTTDPIVVLISEHQAYVQDNIFPACPVNLQKWPKVDWHYFKGDHFYLPFRIIASDQPNCNVTLAFHDLEFLSGLGLGPYFGTNRLLISKPTDRYHNNLGIAKATTSATNSSQ